MAGPALQGNNSLDLLPASALVDEELTRRDRLRRRGNILTACKEVDQYVLLGGLERGCVAGVSADEDELGLLLGLQTVAHLLMRRHQDAHLDPTLADNHPKAMIITTLPLSVLLPKLRLVLVGQISQLQNGLHNVHGQVQHCLENISIARVFDVQGLQEVLGELGIPDSATSNPQQTVKVQNSSESADSGEQHGLLAPNPQIQQTRTDIRDSEDEDKAYDTKKPDIQHHDTTSTFLQEQRPPKLEPQSQRSIFNPTSSHPGHGYPRHQDKHITTRRANNRPSFGQVFSQLLDLHLLCTRVPRMREDTLITAAAKLPAGGGEGAHLVWVVEVLLDEIGVYRDQEKTTGQGEGVAGAGAEARDPRQMHRRCREQRWAAVEIADDGARVVDAF
ncbi:hypothetical protein B0T19DRAFT_481319 [Cercophora scortea]|uniref:Uncharacterized protein n=1 Tax=Cercophora scortea TaxID=314031 RepID=A0AAE0MLD3_9PEZI|nr:hypothetical protein B0T19DRAFT_481319 [Cercophora scortea]